MRLCCALVSLLGICGAMPGQERVQSFEVDAALGALGDRTEAVPGVVQPVHRLARLLTRVLDGEAKAPVDHRRVRVARALPRQRAQIQVEGDKELLDMVQSVLDEMRREPRLRFHLTSTVLVMPWDVAAAHGLSTKGVQKVDMASMSSLLRDVVKQKGALLNLPETIATPLVPSVAETRIDTEGKQPPHGARHMRLRGEAVALSPEEALFDVQLVRGCLPEDRTVVPMDAVLERAFRLRVGTGVTITAKNDLTATVLWLRFTGTSTEAPKVAKADKKDEPDRKDENARR